jgi:hypothetical protein
MTICSLYFLVGSKVNPFPLIVQIFGYLYTLGGMKVKAPAHGIYIQDGRKTVK